MRQQTQPEIKTRKALSIGDRVTAWSMDANLALGNQYCIIRQCFYLYEIPMDSISLISLIPRLNLQPADLIAFILRCLCPRVASNGTKNEYISTLTHII
jgi:hypothetical protein